MANDLYKQIRGMNLISTCVGISIYEWERLMNGSKKANGKKIRALIKKFLPELYESLALNCSNPYERQSKKKNGLFIYVHSGIEYFIEFY